jgi:hypothetical protein
VTGNAPRRRSVKLPKAGNVTTDRAGRRGSAARPISRRILGVLASDQGLLLIAILLGLGWLAGLLWF